MKIAFFISQINKGGAERDMVSLANYMAKDHDVSVILLDGSQTEYQLSSSIVKHVLGNGITQKRSFKAILKRIIDLRKFIVKNNIEGVYCFAPLYTIYALFSIVGVKRDCKVICAVHYNPFYREKFQGRLNRILERIVLPRADGFVFLCNRMKEYYSYSRKIQRKSIIIPNGLVIDGMKDEVIPFMARESNRMCAVGRLDPVKDYPAMIRVFSQFHKNHDDFYLDIYGEGKDRERIERVISELNADDYVILHGNVSDVIERIEKTRYFLMTSESESWGLSLMEAMATGLVCISFDCDFGPREFICNKENGFLIPNRSEKLLLKAMEDAVGDIELSIKISHNALSVREKYKADDILLKQKQYIESVIR